MNLNSYVLFRFFFSIVIVAILKSQTPEWNPVIISFKEKFPIFCPTYIVAKRLLSKITWNFIWTFYAVLIYYNKYSIFPF